MLLIAVSCSKEDDSNLITEKNSIHPVFNQYLYEQGDYFAIPFPHYTRIKNGKIDILKYPNILNTPMLDKFAKDLYNSFNGFGNNSGIFVPFSDEIDTKSISLSVTESTKIDSPLFLINIDPNSQYQGEIIPIKTYFFKGISEYLPTNTLVALPLPGFPMRPGNWYSLILTNKIKDKNGQSISSPETFQQLFASEVTPYSYIKTTLSSIENITFAIPFKTGNPIKEMQLIGKQLYKENIEYNGFDKVDYYYSFPLLTGNLKLPQFQRGNPPYLNDDEGMLVFNNNTAVIQNYQEVRTSILLPATPPPATGYPIVMYSHGTGGDYKSYLYNGVGYYLANMGFAVVGFDQPLHGNRNPRGDGGVDLYTFDIINPFAMRDNIRQGAVDQFGIRNWVNTFYLDSITSPTNEKIFFDNNNIFFFGHSQGALTGALYLATEQYKIKGAILSGSSGGLMLALLYKTAPIDIPVIFEAMTHTYDTFNLYNPLLSMFQMFAESSDPVNYSRYILKNSWRENYLNLFVSEGLVDIYTPPPQNEDFSANLGVDLVKPAYRFPESFSLDNVKILERPVNGNITDVNGNKKATAVLVQYPDFGHFSCFDDQHAIDDWTNFIYSLKNNSIATLK